MSYLCSEVKLVNDNLGEKMEWKSRRHFLLSSIIHLFGHYPVRRVAPQFLFSKTISFQKRDSINDLQKAFFSSS